MALVIKSLSEHITGKELKITDDFYKLKGEFSHNENFFDFTNYKAFEGINAAKTNNLSNIILTQKGYASDILEQNTYKVNKKYILDTLSTTLVFGGYDTSISPKYISAYLNNETEIFELKIIKSLQVNYILVFDITIKDNNICTISFKYNGKQFFIIHDGTELTFSDNPIGGAENFAYHYYDGIINIFVVNNDNIYCLALNESDELILKDEDIFLREYETNYYRNIHIRNQIDIEFPVNSSWVSYERNDDINHVNNKKSAFNLTNQFIIHHEYNTDSSANFIPLKNNLTYKNEVSNGSSLIYSEKEYVDKINPDFRNYTTLSTGINQESGTDTITLNFSFNDQSYKIEEGEDLYFEIPDTKESGDFRSLVLYPYERLNINDAPFMRNGSFSSNSPEFSDKIKYYGKLETNKDENETAYVSKYLCSWLYSDDNTNEVIWLDRYYYPNAINASAAKQSPCNLIDIKIKNSPNEKLDEKLSSNTVYDKKSDIVLHAGGKYKYSRISKDAISELYYSLSKYAWRNMYSNRGASLLTSSTLALNGKNWYKLNNEDAKFKNALHFNADIFLDPTKKMGIQLFGCDYRHGFNIQNRKNLTPFYHFATDDMVYLLNNSHKVCKSLNVKEKYNSTIKALVSDIAFEFIYVIMDNGVLLLNYDLSTVVSVNFDNLPIINEINFENKTMAVYNSDLYIPHKNSIIKLDYNANSSTQLSTEVAGGVKIIDSPPNENSELKSVYIHTDGTLYASYNSIMKLASDKNTLFILSEADGIAPYEVSIIRLDSDSSKQAYFKSKESINNISISSSDEIILIRGFNKDENYEKRRLEIYDKARNRVFTYNLNEYTNILYTSFCNYIDINGIECSGFLVAASRNGIIEMLFYNIENQKVSIYPTILKESAVNVLSVTNDNNIIKFSNENKLYFNLYQQSKAIANFAWDISDIQRGWYNIDVSIDANKQDMIVRINDTILSESKILDGLTNLNQETLFDSSYFVGVVAKNHGLPLSELLYNGIRDPYCTKNTRIKNMTIYNKILTKAERYASLLHFGKVNPLILTIPCGIRTATEEIIRYFKYNKPGNISNKLKINIAGLSGINSKRDDKRLKTYIMDKIKDSGDCLMEINDIEIINNNESE